jgi:hypothetical protein
MADAKSKKLFYAGLCCELGDKEGAFSFPWLRGPVPPAPWVLGRRGAARPWETRRATRFVCLLLLLNSLLLLQVLTLLPFAVICRGLDGSN